MLSNSFRKGFALLIAAAVAGCTSTDTAGVLGVGGNSQGQQQAIADATAGAEVVQGTCPRIELREGTAYFRIFTKKGREAKDPAEIVVQAALSDTTRQCVVSNGQILLNVAVAGRVVAGPAGGSGTYTLPIRVAVVDANDEPVYSELTKYETTLTPGNTTQQFLFQKTAIPVPPGGGQFVRIYVGFDEGPYNTP